jgi:DNA-binding CsgD family transcriptional regulator
MAQIYSSNHLSIDHFNDILIPEWTDLPLTSDLFKKELKIFLGHFKKLRPNGVLWLQEKFNFYIPQDLHQWIEKSIFEPQYKYGLRKLAFTVPRDQKAHLSIIDSFHQVNSVLQPRYFIHKDKALYYLKDGKTTVISNEVKYEISRSLEKTEILLEVHNRHLPHAIKHLDRLKEQFQFRIQQTDRFDHLTLRELEVFKAITAGKLNRNIADLLFISESTVATHRKSINKKLNIKTSKDWHLFATAFL